MFGGNQELATHAEGFHYLLPGAETWLHTTEILFGVPATEDVKAMNGNLFARTQDRRFVNNTTEQWWALTLSGLAFLEMGQLEPRETKPYFPKKMDREAREVIGARRRWGIVVKPDSAYSRASGYNAKLAHWPEVFGPQGIYFTHLHDTLMENVQYLPQGDKRTEAVMRVKFIMSEIREKILGSQELTFQDYLMWLLQHVMHKPAEDTRLCDTVGMFHANSDFEPEARNRLLDIFLADYETVARLYNEAIAPDSCMKQLDVRKRELPYWVHHPAEDGDFWVKETLFLSRDGRHIVLENGKSSSVGGGQVRTYRDIYRAFDVMFRGEYAVIPKAVCFLVQILHLTTFVNPDECHYEALAKDFIRRMWSAGIDFPVAETTYGRQQQIMNALLAFGDQELVLPVEMQVAFKREIATGTELHQILHGEDEESIKTKLEQLLMACAENDKADRDLETLRLLQAAGFLHERWVNSYYLAQAAIPGVNVRKNELLGDAQATLDAACKGLFWEYIDALPKGSRERSLVVRNLYMSGNLDKLVLPSRLREVESFLVKVNNAKSRDRTDPRIDEWLDDLLDWMRHYDAFEQDQYLRLIQKRLTTGGFKCVFGADERPPDYAFALQRRLQLAEAEFDRRRQQLNGDFNIGKYKKSMADAVCRGQVVRAQILKALHSLQLVDYYIGPLVGWVMGGDEYINAIRRQIHVVDHPVAPRL
ncbi:MAG: hypothetical protein ABIG66_02170 [Candidatus Kerfeldbacteria bacterium]